MLVFCLRGATNCGVPIWHGRWRNTGQDQPVSSIGYTIGAGILIFIINTWFVAYRLRWDAWPQPACQAFFIATR